MRRALVCLVIAEIPRSRERSIARRSAASSSSRSSAFGKWMWRSSARSVGGETPGCQDFLITPLGIATAAGFGFGVGAGVGWSIVASAAFNVKVSVIPAPAPFVR